MSYGSAAALQAAVYDRLRTDAALSLLVGDAVFDALPPGLTPPIYVAIGPETVRDRSDQTGRGSEHDFTVTVVTDRSGFATAKQAAGAAADALHEAPLALARGRLVSLRFQRATAGRVGTGDQRQITLLFRARIEEL